jgi:hypothetical protein
VFRTLFRRVARALHKERATKQILMKTNRPTNPVRNSTYAMLVRSEEKERGLFETVIYSLLVLSAVIGIWQFAHLRVPSPFANTPATQVVSGS